MKPNISLSLLLSFAAIPASQAAVIWSENFDALTAGTPYLVNADAGNVQLRNGVTGSVESTLSAFTGSTGNALVLDSTSASDSFSLTNKGNQPIDLTGLTLSASDIYTFSFDIYLPSDTPVVLGDVNFRWKNATQTGNGNTPQDNSQRTLTAGVHNFVFTGTIGSLGLTALPTSVQPFIGIDTGIGGTIYTDYAYVDNIRFDISPVPEPSAAILIGIGSLGLLRRRR